MSPDSYLSVTLCLSVLLCQIHETIESINQLKIQRDFMLSFSRDPKGYIQDWLKSQSRDLKVGRFYLSTRSHLLYLVQPGPKKNMHVMGHLEKPVSFQNHSRMFVFKAQQYFALC